MQSGDRSQRRTCNYTADTHPVILPARRANQMRWLKDKGNVMNEDSIKIDALGSPLELPCGLVLPNRLVKAAMSDSLGDGEGNPTEQQVRLYERWLEGGAALSIIGEVQVDPRYPEKPGNLVLDDSTSALKLQRLAGVAAGHSGHVWPQLGHAGALAHSSIRSGPKPTQVSLSESKSTPPISSRVVLPRPPTFVSPPPGGITAWYTMRLTALAEDREQSFGPTLAEAVSQYESRDAERDTAWNTKFRQ